MKKSIQIGLLLGCFLTFAVYAENSNEKEVKRAYELRISGKVDEARALLEQVLAKDSTCAMAHYEMARIKQYMLVGGGGTTIKEILASAGKAHKYDPANVTYAYYKAISDFLNAFITIQMGGEDVKKQIAETALQFEKVLALKPDYCEPMLYLVEIYGLLPPEMGGDSLKAPFYAKKLSEIDGYFGDRAKAVLASEDTDPVRFWNDLILSKGRNSDYLMEAGKACLLMNNPENAEKYFDEAIITDPSKNILILDMARYHMMKVMQNKDLAAVELPVARKYIEKYLTTTPEPVIPLKAYAKGLLTKIEMFMGDKEEADKLMAESKSLDRYFSKASGIPSLLLFDPPDKISHHYFSFFNMY